jgi:uncharacterized protein (DUF1015 family)
MAAIRPFRSVRYNAALVPDLSAVICQPYDRVRYGLQGRYYDQSPYNVVRIIRGRQEPADRPDRLDGPNAYTRARATYEQWCTQGILIRDPEPALYAYHQTFTVAGQVKTRKSFIAALQLSDFAAGVVLPHEGTHSGPKLDRLRLLRTLKVNTGQVFLLYPDPDSQVAEILDAAIAGRAPNVDATEALEADVRQRLWVVRDRDAIHAIQEAMASKRNLIIADGHHRYETALQFRGEVQPRVNAAANHCMAAMVSMDDPGLVILPTHREVRGLQGLSIESVLSRAKQFFDLVPVDDLHTCTAEMVALGCPSSLEAPQSGVNTTFGLYAQGRYYLLTLRARGLIERWIQDDRCLDWKSLDVTIAHRILLEQVVGLPRQESADQQHLRYHRDPKLAIRNVDAGEANLVVLLNPTRIDQVTTCASQGVKMPPKSTDFYPKMIAGLTMLPVGSSELL